MNRNRAEELRFMTRPQDWPVWPILPVKRPVTKPNNMGCLLEDPPYDEPIKPIVYLTNMFDRKFEDCEKIEYKDWDALLDDGWVVD